MDIACEHNTRQMQRRNALQWNIPYHIQHFSTQAIINYRKN
uniref:Uncharacterized protein n=1 Tax=Arundo donax TaxID=35708 RepID=A0A0A9A5E6_ARUDO